MAPILYGEGYMAEDTNALVLVGRLTRDAEAPDKGPVKFSIASNRRVKIGDQFEDEVSFFDVVYWHKSIIPQLVKGKQICIFGNIKQDRWEQDGQKRSRIVIDAKSIQLLGNSPQEAPAESIDNDEIPF